MLKLPKGLKKKKKGKKSKRKGEEELFTEEELEKYRKEHQQQGEGEGSTKENEEWSKFKDLTTGVDSILKKTQGDLDRIKSTSFFQRVPAGPKEIKVREKEEPRRPIVEVTEADFPHLAATAAADVDSGEKSDYGVTDDESEEEDDQDDIFDTSYVEAVERGEVKLAYVPDSPEEFQNDDIFDTSHVDALIKGQETKTSKGKKGVDIGVAVEVLTGRIDNLKITSKRSKRVIPGDLLLESVDKETIAASSTNVTEPVEKSILDIDTDVPIDTPIDLSVSLHTSLLQQQQQQQQKSVNEEEKQIVIDEEKINNSEDLEIDEFTLLAAESLDVKSIIPKLDKQEIKVAPVLQESWSAFEADKNESVFAEGIVEDQLDVIDPYIDQDDPFDTSFADAIIPTTDLGELKKNAAILDDDDDFDPRAEEIQVKLNNRRKSSVKIHLINPSGIRESITSDEVIETETIPPKDLLGGSTTDLTQLGDSPLNPVDINDTELDPFDTTIVDKIVAPGKVELKLLEQELIGSAVSALIYRVHSDPDFDPRADEPKQLERRASRPENLVVSKSVVFNVDGVETSELDVKSKPSKPLTPYYTREVSITEDLSEEIEGSDRVAEILTRTRSVEDLTVNVTYESKRRHSEYTHTNLNKNNITGSDLLHSNVNEIEAKVLTPITPKSKESFISEIELDPFDTSFATDIKPGKTELKLLTKEFSCEDSKLTETKGETDLLEPEDDIFQAKALTPEPLASTQISEGDFDPFDTSFASDLNPGKTELKLLESEFLN